MHPSVERLLRVAEALEDLADEVVFIGGAITPLLHDDPPFEQARLTKDVDAVIASRTYADVGALGERLRALGFRQGPQEAGRIHRWVSPGDDILDLLPAGGHLGGTGQRWDQVTIGSSVRVELEGGWAIRHAGAPAFLALKWAAHEDRGKEDPFASYDLEDILALLAARPPLVSEVEVAPRQIAQYVTECSSELVAGSDLHDLLAAHLNNAQDPAIVCRSVHDRLNQLAAIVS